LNALRVSWLYFKVGVMNELQYRVNFFVRLLQAYFEGERVPLEDVAQCARVLAVWVMRALAPAG